MSEAPVELSVIVVNFNTREDTLACLRSVRSTAPVPLEIVVVDNGSSDGSLAAFEELSGATGGDVALQVVDAGANLGFAAGVNLGVARSSGRQVLLLNPDTLMLPGSLASLLEFAVRHPERGVYGGRTLRRDGSLDPSSCWGAMSVWSLTCFATMLTTLARGSRFLDPESLGRWQRDTVREVPVVTGCLLLISRAGWDALRGMDETYFLYGEDADFSARAWGAGLRPTIVPEAEIIHAVGGSTASSGRKMAMVLAGKTTYLRGHWSDGKARLGVALLLAGVGLRALMERATRAHRTTWREVWHQRSAWVPGYPAAREPLFGR